MDENPLQGEPGSFVMASTGRNLVDKRDKEQREREAANAAKGTQDSSTRIGSVAPTPTPAPANRATDGLKKSAGAGAKGKSPISPVGDGGVKKRRKSKAPGTPGLASPTSPAVQQP
jgi:mediator of RNA polymerase II transcription subunit 6